MRHQPQYIHQRTSTVLAVEKLLDSGRYATHRDALAYALRRAAEKGLVTGFEADTFEKSYERYRLFRSRHKRHITTHIELP